MAGIAVVGLWLRAANESRAGLSPANSASGTAYGAPLRACRPWMTPLSISRSTVILLTVRRSAVSFRVNSPRSAISPATAPSAPTP